MEIKSIDEQTRLRRERTKHAITAAMESRWEDAVTANRQVLESEPNDIEALNRLGKALSELGRYPEARDAFKKALVISPNNAIAKKNMERLSLLAGNAKSRAQHTRVPPQFFIEETGKTGIVSLASLAPKETLARISAGEPLTLEAGDHRLLAKTADGDYVGIVDPKVGLRLLGFMRGGNKYAAAVTSADRSGVKVFVRETYQHTSQRGRLSFPPRGLEDVRPYVLDSTGRYIVDDDEDTRASGSDDWGEFIEERPRIDQGLRRLVRVGADDEDEY